MRFVLLEHDTRPVAVPGAAPPLDAVHWDLMLEQPGASTLRTWRLLRNPCEREADCIPAEPIGDHRQAYLDFQGELSGGRGRVRRIDRGDVELLPCGTTGVRLRLHGERLTGEFEIRAASGSGVAFCRISVTAGGDEV